MERMVLGFIFDQVGDEVLLIKKTRPEWQKGMLNGLGGHLEKGEIKNLDYVQAFIREVKEECNLDIPKSDIVTIGVIRGENQKFNIPIYAYKMKSVIEKMSVRQTTDEKPIWCKVDYINRRKVIKNLTFLVPYAWYVLHSENLKSARIIIGY